MSTFWNPSFKAASNTLSNGNRTLTNSNSTYGGTRTVDSVGTGILYAELLCTSINTGGNIDFGIVNTSYTNTAAWPAQTANGISMGVRNGEIASNNATITTITGATAGQRVCICLNTTADRVYFRVNNGSWHSSGDPVAGTGGTSTASIATGTRYLVCTVGATDDNVTLYTAAADWAYTPPTGAVGFGLGITVPATTQSLAIGQSAAAALAIQSNTTQSLSIGQSAAGAVALKANATQSLSIAQSATSALAIAASAAQSLGIGQSATGSVGAGIMASASQSLGIGQSAAGSVAISGSATQSLAIGQSAAATVAIKASAAQSLGIGQSAAGTHAVSDRNATAAQSLSIGQSSNAELGQAPQKRVRFQLPDLKEKNPAIIVRALRNIATGRSLANDTVTLAASATSTMVEASWVAEEDVIMLMPTTSSAATAMAAGYYIEAAKGSFTIHHASNAAADQTFRWYSAGG